MCTMKSFITLVATLLIGGTAHSLAQPRIQPVHFSEVIIDDSFWKNYAHKVSEVTVPVCMEYTESKNGRIRNFERAAGLLNDGKGHEGIYYDDSDVYKVLEAIAYSLKVYPSPQIEKRADKWIDKIAAAQERGDTPLSGQWESQLLNGVYTLPGQTEALTPNADGTSAIISSQSFKAIPYFAWANRGKQPMQVWIPRRVTSISLNKE